MQCCLFIHDSQYHNALEISKNAKYLKYQSMSPGSHHPTTSVFLTTEVSSSHGMVRTTGWGFALVEASVIMGRAIQQVTKEHYLHDVDTLLSLLQFPDPAFHPSFLLPIGSHFYICSKIWYFCSHFCNVR